MLDAKKYAANNIVSFTFEGQGIYNELFNHYEKSHNTIPDEKLIYATGPLNYAICVDNNQMTFFDSAAGIVSYNVVQNMCSRNRVITESQKKSNSARIFTTGIDYTGGFFSNGQIPSTGAYDGYIIHAASTFSPTEMSTYLTGEYEGNCAPTAAANILNYYREKRGFTALGASRQNIYDAIVSNSGWDKDNGPGMSFSQLKTGVKKVVEDAGYHVSFDNYLFDWWSSWVDDLNRDRTVYTVVSGSRPDDDSGAWINVSHAIVAVGWREYNDGPRYLCVWNGWSTSMVYMYFNSNYFDSINGYMIHLTK